MKTIQGKNAAVTSEEDVIGAGGSLTLPTTARKHAIVSSSEEDDNNGEFQVETATVGADPCTTSGDATVTVTAAGMENTPKAITVALIGGTLQVETATIVGTIGAAGAGNVSVVVTSAIATGSPITTPVAVANDDTAAQVAGKIRTALGLVAAITTHYTVGGSDATVSLTAKVKAANDATLNIAYANGTASGLTEDATSAHTTAGVASDTTNVIATKIRAALAADEDVTAMFTVSGETSKVILTKKTSGANDATLNIAIAAGSTGITAVATSADTTEGSGGSGARIILIEGINENYEEVTEQVTLNGETAVNTTKYYFMINKMQVLRAGSYGTNKGYIAATALTDNSETCRILADAGESQNAVFMNANRSTQTVSKLFFNTQNTTSGAITTFKVKVKEDGRAWCTKRVVQIIAGSPAVEVQGGVEIPKKAILKVTAVASAGSSDVNVHAII